jgi:hypothetical protein
VSGTDPNLGFLPQVLSAMGSGRVALQDLTPNALPPLPPERLRDTRAVHYQPTLEEA